mmetsp:Transcript_14257/g.20500  ORF Transcript_14257/g.20500 Transcript_14257/m.20500 type:complete len:94 (-) Transcript_14257:1876-2157(-)
MKTTCDFAMLEYINHTLPGLNFQCQPNRHCHEMPQYGAKIQFTNDPQKWTKRIQEILGTLLYYANLVDSNMLLAIGTIITQQATSTKKTSSNC